MRETPAALLEHIQQPVTTTTRLLKIMGRNGLVYGLAMLDANVTYDDGEGELIYYATNGFDPSAFASDTGYSVDNAEGYALISDEVPGVDVEMIEAGELDDGQWVCYLVNYRDTSMGHIVMDGGDLGEVRTRFGMIWIPELLSFMSRLKQPVGSVWSRRCRAIFGSHPNQQTGCGVNLAPLWVPGEVVEVGSEINRVFTGDQVTIGSPAIIPYPGRVQFLTGDNAGREFATEEVDGTVVSLNEPTAYAIQVGDTYRIRPDCGKRYQEDCIDIWDNRLNFKGEPFIPVGDSTANQAPGAQTGGGEWNGETIIEN